MKNVIQEFIKYLMKNVIQEFTTYFDKNDSCIIATNMIKVKKLFLLLEIGYSELMK